MENSKTYMTDIPKAVRIGYGPYETKQEAQDAEDNAWLAIPLKERLKILGLPEDFDPKVGIKKK